MAAEGDCPSQFTGQSWSVWTERLGPESLITESEDQDRKIEADSISYNCPSQFMGQPWSVWTDHIGRNSPISDEENNIKYQADAMRLPKEEMGLFGHCPERDPFYTVVCEFCDTSVKPQGLGNHMDLWHKVTTIEEAVSGTEPSEKMIKCSMGPKPDPGALPTPGNMKIKIKKPQSSTPGSIPMDQLLSSNQVLANNILPAESAISLTKGVDKMLLQSENAIGMGCNQTVPSGPVSLQPVVALTPLHSANGLATIMSILPRLGFQAPCFPETLNTNTNSTTVTSHNHSLNFVSGEQLNHNQRASGSPQKKRLKSDRLPVKEREYDPDKHCGVWNEESNKHCTRSLTCKTHSKSMQRAVTGRSKHFDKLLADHRAAKEVAGKLGKTLGIVQVSGLEGDCGQLPSSVSVSTNMVSVTDIPASCVGSLATPLSLSPDGQVNGIQNSSFDSQCVSYPASVPLPPILPTMKVDSFTPVKSVVSHPSKASVLSSVEHFTPGACHLPRPPEEPASLKFVPRLEDAKWLRSQPKPVTVCSFSTRQIGHVMANNRKVEVFCHRLKTALTQGCIRIPHSIQRTGKEKVLTVRQKPVAQRVVFHS